MEFLFLVEETLYTLVQVFKAASLVRDEVGIERTIGLHSMSYRQLESLAARPPPGFNKNRIQFRKGNRL